MPVASPIPSRPLWQWDATEIAAATRSGQVSVTEVTRAVLDRVDAVNPHLNAITLDLADAALARAAELDAARAAGAETGPLHGVPVTIKDNVDVAGQRTPNGLAALAGVIAPEDSPVTANLLAAGVVIVGRTNTPEVSMRPTTNNPLYGLTRNPWRDDISCGGSSGGAGASVASGMGALGHGNDIGGSVRIPALHCGVPGIKPTLGRVPAYLPSATVERSTIAALMSVQGVLARTVADVRVGLAAMARRDVRDPWWVPAPLEGPPVPRRAAVLRGLDGVPTAPDAALGVERAAAALAAAGYEVVEVAEADTPGLKDVAALAFRLLMADLDHQLGPLLARVGSPEMLRYWRAIADSTPPYRRIGEHIDDLARRSTLLRAWMLFLERYPVVVMPELLDGLLEVDQDIRSDADSIAVWDSLRPSIAMNLLGLPVALAPTGLVEEGHLAGMPTGAQLVASRYREDVALEAAAAVEATWGVLAHRLWTR